MNKRSERGQILILLLLIVLVVLTVVLAIAERSTSSLSNSDKTDQSSRAFAAAEAGVEQASLMSSGSISLTNLPDQSSYSVSDTSLQFPTSGTMLEYPKIGKETVAQFWLVDPNNISSGSYYRSPTIWLYFGNYDPTNPANTMDISKPDAEAVEVDYISCASACGTSTGDYREYKQFYDSQATRIGGNGFTLALCPTTSPLGWIAPDASELGSNRPFRCKYLIPLNNYPAEEPILMRVRVLYNNEKQSLALDPVGTNIPLQARFFTSTGISGNSIQKIQVFQVPNVVTPFMDYALFSYGDISK